MNHPVPALATSPNLSTTSYHVETDRSAREDAIQRDADIALITGGAWGEFLRKVLAPGVAQPTMRLLRASQA